MNKIVAVTGGTGLIGRYLINSLLADGLSVRVLTRNPDTAMMLWGDRAEIWPGDVTIANSLNGFTSNVSIVYNLAGAYFESDKVRLVNENGTINLLNLCVGQSIERFVHLSSVGVYGPSHASIINENTECNPSNDYEKSEHYGELAAIDYWYQREIPITILRPTIVFGAGRNQEKDSFASWMQAIQSGRYRFFGNGEYIANYIYAEDVAEACIHITKFDQAIGEIYIVSDSCFLREFVGTAADLMNVHSLATIPLWIAKSAASASSILEKISALSLPLTKSRLQALTNTTKYSSHKLHRTLGYQPMIGYREGLNRTIEWYKEQGTLAN